MSLAVSSRRPPHSLTLVKNPIRPIESSPRLADSRPPCPRLPRIFQAEWASSRENMDRKWNIDSTTCLVAEIISSEGPTFVFLPLRAICHVMWLEMLGRRGNCRPRTSPHKAYRFELSTTREGSGFPCRQSRRVAGVGSIPAAVVNYSILEDFDLDFHIG